MKPFSDQELEHFLDEVESDRVERKESWAGSAPEKARQAVCAFANDLPNNNLPGILFVGAKDDGTPSGLKITDQLELILADMKTDGKIIPPPTISVQKRVLKGQEMAVVTVLPSNAPPVRYDGRIWIRIGPRRGLATAQDESILNERRRFRDLPFDIQPIPSCPMSDLNRSIFEYEYLTKAVAPDVLAANERTYEERLAASRMISSISSPVPTVLGVMTIGRSPRDWIPGCYVQFLRINGLEWTDPIIDSAEIDGTLFYLINRLDDKFRAHVMTSVDLVSNDIEQRKSNFPLVAIQQFARNAIMHRTYEHTNTPIRIYWFDDRIEIISPGGPYGIVTAENFGRPGATDYRNPHIAEAMKVFGYVQRFGVGIATAQKALRDNGNPPAEFDVDDKFIIITMFKKA